MIVSAVISAPVMQPSDVFEQPHPAGPRKIEFHISVPEVAKIEEGDGPGQGPECDEDGGKIPLGICSQISMWLKVLLSFRRVFLILSSMCSYIKQAYS